MKVVNPKQSLDTSKITLGNPTPVQGGSYFTKLKIGDEPLYAQMPKCLTRKGIVHTGKNDYCDLMYERNDEEQLIEWIENIESCCQDLIDNKKNIWFHTDLSRDDITTMMSPICRIYRSGKNILIRVSIDKNKHTGQSKCIAYNEEECLVEIDELTPEQKIIPLICIDGIKFTSRSFEICISLYQFMILNKEEDLEINKRCMISLDKPDVVHKELSVTNSSTIKEDHTETNVVEKEICDDEDESNISLAKTSNNNLDLGNTNIIKPPSPPPSTENLEDKDNDNMNNDNMNNDNEVNTTEIEETVDDSPMMEEVNLDVNSDESIQLKKSSEVYYEIYKDAKQKAKEMREAALKAYLEAEKIKMKFSLEDMEDESDFDDSHSDVSDTCSISETSANLAEN